MEDICYQDFGLLICVLCLVECSLYQPSTSLRYVLRNSRTSHLSISSHRRVYSYSCVPSTLHFINTKACFWGWKTAGT